MVRSPVSNIQGRVHWPEFGPVIFKLSFCGDHREAAGAIGVHGMPALNSNIFDCRRYYLLEWHIFDIPKLKSSARLSEQWLIIRASTSMQCLTPRLAAWPLISLILYRQSWIHVFHHHNSNIHLTPPLNPYLHAIYPIRPTKASAPAPPTSFFHPTRPVLNLHNTRPARAITTPALRVSHSTCPLFSSSCQLRSCHSIVSQTPHARFEPNGWEGDTK